MLLPGHYSFFRSLLKADELNHFVAEEYLPIFVQGRGTAPSFNDGSGGSYNFFWNRGFWNVPSCCVKQSDSK